MSALLITDSIRKPADARYPIHDLIGQRWSPRAFAARRVERATLQSLFEAARWAASGGNQQPWNFIVASNEYPEEHERLAAVLWERNHVWARHAPVLILVVARLYPYPGKEQLSFYDVGMAVGNLVTQAVDMGLVTHQMGGFDADKARETLGIPDGYTPLAVIALGYPGSLDVLPDHLRQRELEPRTRKSIQEFVHEGCWQHPDPQPAV